MTAIRSLCFGLLLTLTTACATVRPPPAEPADPTPVAPVKLAPTPAENWETSLIVNAGKGHGTGTVIHESGLILTCAHVAEPGVPLTVAIDTDVGEVLVPAKIVARDAEHDIAVISVKVRFPRAAELEDDGQVLPYDLLYGAGFPFELGKIAMRGHVMRPAVTLSVKESKRKTLELVDQIMADLNDGSGSSGSGVFLERTGRLVGVMRAAAAASTGENDKTFFKLIIPVSQVRVFLKNNGIPHHDATGEVKPVPPPAADTNAGCTPGAAKANIRRPPPSKQKK